MNVDSPLVMRNICRFLMRLKETGNVSDAFRKTHWKNIQEFKSAIEKLREKPQGYHVVVEVEGENIRVLAFCAGALNRAYGYFISQVQERDPNVDKYMDISNYEDEHVRLAQLDPDADMENYFRYLLDMKKKDVEQCSTGPMLMRLLCEFFEMLKRTKDLHHTLSVTGWGTIQRMKEKIKQIQNETSGYLAVVEVNSEGKVEVDLFSDGYGSEAIDCLYDRIRKHENLPEKELKRCLVTGYEKDGVRIMKVIPMSGLKGLLRQISRKQSQEN